MSERRCFIHTPSAMVATIVAAVMSGVACGDGGCDLSIEPTFTVVLPKVTIPPDPFSWDLPPV